MVRAPTTVAPRAPRWLVAVPRALWRLAAASNQALRGAAIVGFRFPRLDDAGRQAEVGRWARGVLDALGIGLEVDGRYAGPGTLLASNHVSWLDILAIHAVVPAAQFVSKAAVRDWPLIGPMATAAGTLYLERERKRDALRLVGVIGEALVAGQTVAVFPEGTTADGCGLLPFHANLLQASITAGASVQPVALRYSDAESAISRAVEFVGETTLWQSVWRVVSAERLVVRLSLLPACGTAGTDRRALATGVQAAIEARLAGPR